MLSECSEALSEHAHEKPPRAQEASTGSVSGIRALCQMDLALILAPSLTCYIAEGKTLPLNLSDPICKMAVIKASTPELSSGINTVMYLSLA